MCVKELLAHHNDETIARGSFYDFFNWNSDLVIWNELGFVMIYVEVKFVKTDSF